MALLGQAAGQSITLDADAAGYGWYVDPTPLDDAEFAATHFRLWTLDSRLSTPHGPADGRDARAGPCRRAGGSAVTTDGIMYGWLPAWYPPHAGLSGHAERTGRPWPVERLGS